MSQWSTKINVRMISANPIIKLINLFMSILEFFTGVIRSGTLVEENDSIVINTKQKFFWFFTTRESELKIAKEKITGIRVSTVRSWLFFSSNACSIFASGVSEQVEYTVRCSYKEIKEKSESWLK